MGAVKIAIVLHLRAGLSRHFDTRFSELYRTRSLRRAQVCASIGHHFWLQGEKREQT